MQKGIVVRVGIERRRAYVSGLGRREYRGQECEVGELESSEKLVNVGRVLNVQKYQQVQQLHCVPQHVQVRETVLEQEEE